MCVAEFDKKEFSRLLLLAVGDRSLNQYAKYADVSAAHISRLSRSIVDTPPNPETIRKLASKAANGVTYADLMKAAGHLPDSSDDQEKKIKDIDWDAPLREKDLASALQKITDMTYEHNLPQEKRMMLAEKAFLKFGPPPDVTDDKKAAHGPSYPGSGALRKNVRIPAKVAILSSEK